MTVRNAKSWRRGWTGQRLNGNGEVIERDIRPDDYEIFRAFAWSRFWGKDHLAAYLGRNPQATSRRLKELAEKDTHYTKLAGYHRQKKKNLTTGYLFYERDYKTDEWLEKRDIPFETFTEDSKIFEHDLMADQIVQDMMIGANKCPAYELNILPLPRKFELRPITNVKTGKSIKQSLISDKGPMEIVRRADGKRRYIAAIEADRGTMTAFTKHEDRSSIARKIRNYVWLIRSGEMKRVLGFIGYIPIVTYSETHKQHLMKVLEAETRNYPEVRKYFLFDTYPMFGEDDYVPDVSGRMFTGAKERVGYPPVYFNKEA